MSPPASAATASESSTTTVFEEDTREEVSFSATLIRANMPFVMICLLHLVAGLSINACAWCAHCRFIICQLYGVTEKHPGLQLDMGVFL